MQRLLLAVVTPLMMPPDEELGSVKAAAGTAENTAAEEASDGVCQRGEAGSKPKFEHVYCRTLLYKMLH